MIDDWLDALYSRHAGALRPPELLKAIRALSVRYVQRRTEIASRSPIDLAGKKAAFALFFAPLHFLITREIVRAVGANSARRGRSGSGCGWRRIRGLGIGDRHTAIDSRHRSRSLVDRRSGVELATAWPARPDGADGLRRANHEGHPGQETRPRTCGRRRLECQRAPPPRARCSSTCSCGSPKRNVRTDHRTHRAYGHPVVARVAGSVRRRRRAR